MSLSRRALLAGAAGLAGCRWLHRGADWGWPPAGPVVLGWRWAPGQTLRYRTHLRRKRLGEETLRSVEWTYRVESVGRDGTADLAGWRTGIAAGLRGADGVLTDVEPERTSNQVAVKLGLDGRVLACSLSDWADALPHRLLGLHLPEQAVALHAEWEDSELPSLFARLLPAEDRSVRTRVQLVALPLAEDGPTAVLDSEGTLAIGTSGPSVDWTDRVVFDVVPGRLRARSLRARLGRAPGDPADAPGVLEVDVEAVA